MSQTQEEREKEVELAIAETLTVELESARESGFMLSPPAQKSIKQRIRLKFEEQWKKEDTPKSDALNAVDATPLHISFGDDDHNNVNVDGAPTEIDIVSNQFERKDGGKNSNDDDARNAATTALEQMSPRERSKLEKKVEMMNLKYTVTSVQKGGQEPIAPKPDTPSEQSRKTVPKRKSSGVLMAGFKAAWKTVESKVAFLIPNEKSDDGTSSDNTHTTTAPKLTSKQNQKPKKATSRGSWQAPQPLEKVFGDCDDNYAVGSEHINHVYERWFEIIKECPGNLTMDVCKRIFASDKHGSTLSQLYKYCERASPTMLVVTLKNSRKIGGFCSHAWAERYKISTEECFGDATCFLWRENADGTHTTWHIPAATAASGEDLKCIHATDDHLALGHGLFGYGLEVNQTLQSGSSYPETSFENEALVETAVGHRFEVALVEVWGFGDIAAPVVSDVAPTKIVNPHAVGGDIDGDVDGTSSVTTASPTVEAPDEAMWL
eukprot:m.201804 g.201804  ORF g.201804 m.201804 type:complete len:492 (+) comp32806_c6_seq1:157-1632(+)